MPEPQTEAVPDENRELLRRLDRWDPQYAGALSEAGALIGWAAAHLRGCVELPTPAQARDAALAEALAAVLDVEPVSLGYPSGLRHNGTPLDHEEGCAFAYGNTTYPCHCFIPRQAAIAALRRPGGAA